MRTQHYILLALCSTYWMPDSIVMPMAVMLATCYVIVGGSVAMNGRDLTIEDVVTGTFFSMFFCALAFTFALIVDFIEGVSIL